ncbi:hypothetical protein PGT21_017238 [Puccinia graminis f. sp. tritici]|uniref:Uncharacterized protein n=1 Tax=Puccinia graminis f. sp. tritici TaxID=56615 RepID=A0A5B0QRJ4_PUCGR|nr:hypothetical protein PGT21_017238 [Puccinia graminis f. sp. tritici]KAA1115779.1 hypothetical protein PGTUg99_031691 [Puccinia graminis f. sp. tritici]
MKPQDGSGLLEPWNQLEEFYSMTRIDHSTVSPGLWTNDNEGKADLQAMIPDPTGLCIIFKPLLDSPQFRLQPSQVSQPADNPRLNFKNLSLQFQV